MALPVGALLWEEKGGDWERFSVEGEVRQERCMLDFNHPSWHPGSRALPVTDTFSEAPSGPGITASSPAKGQVYELSRCGATSSRFAELV